MRPIFLYIAAAVVAILVAIVAVVEFGPETTPTGSTSASLPKEALPGDGGAKDATTLSQGAGDAAREAPPAGAR